MKLTLLIGLGGFLGTIARYHLSGWLSRQPSPWPLPWGTLAVNLLGCLVTALIWIAGERSDFLSPTARLFLFTGLLGGFTTFSAFGLETVLLLQKHLFLMAALNVLISLLGGVGILWLTLRFLALPRG